MSEERNTFKLELEEAVLLERIAEATKMDAWFRIDENLHAHDEEGCRDNGSDAEIVCALEDGLAYGLEEPQSGGLSKEEAGKVEACFARARKAMEAGKKPMTGEEVRQMLLGFSYCKGFYSRLYLDVECMRQEDPEAYAKTLAEWEAQEFTEPIQVIRYFEEGIQNRKPAAKYWRVPVVYEMYGSVDVEAESAEEAYRKAKGAPEEYGLPEEAFYVEGSFRVADDDEANAVELIKELSGNEEAKEASHGL